MSGKTGISWTDSTWPVVTGCTHISEGCDNCYAARLTGGRLRHLPAYSGLADKGRFNGSVRLLPERLDWPANWRGPRRIFVSDMADLFHSGVPDGYIARVWDVMGRHQQHTYQILTKRHARMRSWLRRWADRAGDGDHDKDSGMPPMPRGPEAVRTAYSSGRARLFADMLDSMGEPPEGCAYPSYDWMDGQRFWGTDLFNVWCGVSVENQHWADIRIPSLLDTPAAVRFLSCEPLLGPVDLSQYLCEHQTLFRRADDASRWLCAACNLDTGMDGADPVRPPAPGWVIVGGESGPGHRPMDIAWLESIVSQCREARVPVFVKQDSGPRAGQQGRIPDDLWIKEFPGRPVTVA